jgi:hypothetical protein
MMFGLEPDQYAQSAILDCQRHVMRLQKPLDPLPVQKIGIVYKPLTAA